MVLLLVGEAEEVQLQTRWKDRDGQPTVVEASHLSRVERDSHSRRQKPRRSSLLISAARAAISTPQIALSLRRNERTEEISWQTQT